MDDQTVLNMLTLSSIPFTAYLERYLGVPSIHGRVIMSSFGSVIDSMNVKLEGWKMRYLSLTGRQVLTQSVLSVIPFYPI